MQVRTQSNPQAAFWSWVAVGLTIILLVFGSPSWAQDASPEDSAIDSEWHIDLYEVERDYVELLSRWKLVLDGSSEKRGKASVEQLELEAKADMLRAQQDELRSRERDLQRRRAAIERGLTLHNELVDERQKNIDESRLALEVYRGTLVTELEEAKRPRAVLSALERWWTAHTQMNWSDYFQTGVDPRTGFSEELQVEAAEISPQMSEAAKMLLRLARDEEEQRREMHKLILRHEVPDLASLNEQIAALESELRDVERRLGETEQKLTNIGPQLLSGEERQLLSDTESLLAEYRFLQRLLAGPDTPAIRIEDEHWCSLYTHGGVLGSLLQDPTAPEQLRVAVSAYGGGCAAPYTSSLHEHFLVSIWAEARLLAAQHPSVQVLFEDAPGYWRLDGVRLEGAGRLEIVVTPGLHRLEYFTGDAAQPVDTLVEEINASEQLGFWIDRNQIVMDRINDSRPWIVPVRSDTPVAEADIDLTPDPNWRVAVYGTSLRFNASNHIGGTAEVRLVVGRWMPIALESGLAFDGLGSDTPYSYRGASTPALLRMRGVALVRPLRERGPMTPTGYVSLGFIPPFQAVTLDAGGGLELDVRPSWAVTARLGMNASFWRDDVTWMEPVVQLGVVRAFGASRSPWTARLKIRRER